MKVDFTSDDWSFRLDGVDELAEEEKPKGMIEMIPYISTPDRWEQYTDPFVYEADAAIRNWIGKMCENKSWVNGSGRNRRYTLGMIYEQAFGRQWTNGCNKFSNKLARIARYYSSKVQKNSSINGKNYSKTTYTISPNRFHKQPPYSLKLRLEWFADHGILPDNRNMELPKDDLKPGHARNPRTNANMERRSREAKDRFNERYNSKRDRRKERV